MFGLEPNGGACGQYTFVTGVKVGLSVGLQVAGDVGCAEHLSTDATGDFAFVSDHVGTESVFGGKSGGTGLHQNRRGRGVRVRRGRDAGRVATRFDTYRYLTFKWSFGGMHMLHMAAQMVRSVQKETRSRLNFGPQFFSF